MVYARDTLPLCWWMQLKEKDLHLLLSDRCTSSIGVVTSALQSVCVCARLPACRVPSAMPVTSQLLRALPRSKVLASSLLPCQQHQSQFGPVAHLPASRKSAHMWQRRQPSRSYQTSSVLHSYILTPPQVNSILKANEYSFKVCWVVDKMHFAIRSSIAVVYYSCCNPRCQSLMGKMCLRWWVSKVISCQPTLPSKIAAAQPRACRREGCCSACLTATLAAPVHR